MIFKIVDCDGWTEFLRQASLSRAATRDFQDSEIAGQPSPAKSGSG